MTFTPTDYETALQTWIRTVLAGVTPSVTGDRIIPANDNGPRPSDADGFVTFQVTRVISQGRPHTELTDTVYQSGPDYERRTTQHYRGRVDINIYGPGSRDRVEELRLSIEDPLVQEANRKNCVAVIYAEDAQDLSALAGPAFEERMRCEFTFGFVRQRISRGEAVEEIITTDNLPGGAP